MTPHPSSQATRNGKDSFKFAVDIHFLETEDEINLYELLVFTRNSDFNMGD